MAHGPLVEGAYGGVAELPGGRFTLQAEARQSPRRTYPPRLVARFWGCAQKGLSDGWSASTISVKCNSAGGKARATR